MIKAILLDVDGVIVGTRDGVNFPYPSESVITGLKSYQNKGIPISLITAKTNFSSTRETIKRADLNNLHVTDAGAVLIDPISYTIASKHPLDKDLALSLLRSTDIGEIFWEVYTIEDWYGQKDVQTDIRIAHEKVLDMPIKIVDDIYKFTEGLDEIIKLMIVYPPSQKAYLKEKFAQFEGKVQFQWGGNPKLLPNEVLNITALGVSKKSGAEELAKYYGISLDEVLGVGDTLMDWEFMEDCGYAGAMGNSTKELLDKVVTKEKSKYYFGKNVNEDGVLDIIKHFDDLGLISYKGN
jgi:hydroxymethylpyrimidine pyrophosphatase-like HAD family hydrolase